jgi:hypothetical protein
MRIGIILIFVLISTIAFSQIAENEKLIQEKTYSYAYISIQGKLFSKKLKVEVDFGDLPEQMKLGEEYSTILTNKKSYAAILNYMVENDFELVETLDYNYTYSGTGGTSGIVFIMRKKK